MCGIIGRVGSDNAAPYLFEGLKRLEYRGYDSAGMAVIASGAISCRKAIGRLENLQNETERSPICGDIGIGHTRWATHGAPSVKNAHPHMSSNGKFAIVHNGIIENAAALKAAELAETEFVSETDTEVIVHLLQKYFHGNPVETLAKVTTLLEGSYALGIICTEFPDTLICTAKSSPLIAAFDDDGSFIASDISAVVGYATMYFPISDGEICLITKQSIKLFNNSGKAITKKTQLISADALSDGKQGYEHYMMLEMQQQPDAVRNTLLPLIENGKITMGELEFEKNFLTEELGEIVIIACGSAYHTGLVGKQLIEKLCHIPCRTEIASEFRYSNPLIGRGTLAVFISQSGETADTLAALRIAKKKGAQILSIVNVSGSAIAMESDRVIYTKAGREIAVATTKAYSAQLSVLYSLALYIASEKKSISEKRISELTAALAALPEKISEALEKTHLKAEEIAAELMTAQDIYMIGRQLDYAAVTEGSLKCKEISYIHSEAYAAGELKHGTISLIEPGTPVIAVATDESVIAKTISNIREVEARGAHTVLITFEKFRELAVGINDCIFIPETVPELSVSVSVLPLQLLSYYIAKNRGCDIDKPKNLAKSVTVE